MSRLSLLVLLVVLAGCIPAIHHPQIERVLEVPESPQVAWRKAIQTTLDVHCQIHYQDVQLGRINATAQRGGVTLNILLTPQGSGSHLVVASQVAPTHIGTSRLTEDWIAAYQRQP